jgi:hypothetical protein
VLEKATAITGRFPNNTKEDKNPAKLGHKSPGVTVDFGLHDHQIAISLMIPMQLGQTILPPGSTSI